MFIAELKFALDAQGYKLLDVYEVQFYPKYDLTLFQNLLKSFFMMKVASKGKNLLNGLKLRPSTNAEVGSAFF